MSQQKTESYYQIYDIINQNMVAKPFRWSGESMKPELGETVVKAVTYYEYKLEKIKKGYKVTVSLDI